MLNNSILKILTFFDVQDMPLTLLEIKAYLDKRASMSQIQRTLDFGLIDQVETDGVFYYLRGRQDLAEKRHRTYRLSMERMRRTRKYLWFLRFMPFVRGVAASGSQALLASREDSDIDLFIITARDRIWLARTLITLYFQMLGARRHGRFTRNRFCLNHYIDEDLRIERDKNLYTAILYASFLPVFGEEYFVGFHRRNAWIHKYIARPLPEHTNHFFRFRDFHARKVLEVALELTLLAPFLNFLSRVYQKSRITPQEHVHVSDQELSFHPDSKGQRILAKFRQKISRDTT